MRRRRRRREANLCLRHCLQFSSLAYDLTHKSRRRMYDLKIQEIKIPGVLNLSSLCNFKLFASTFEGNNSHQKLRNCWVAKKLNLKLQNF